MAANPLLGGGRGYDVTAGGVERAPDAYGAALESTEVEDARLRKKFRGKLPPEVLAPINADTHWGVEERLRKRLLSLLKTNLNTVRRDPAAFFRDEAGDIAHMLRESESLRVQFLDTLLWDLCVFRRCF